MRKDLYSKISGSKPRAFKKPNKRKDQKETMFFATRKRTENFFDRAVKGIKIKLQS